MSILLVHLISIPNYNSNEIVDILLVLGECRNNYRRAVVFIIKGFLEEDITQMII